MRKTYEAWIDDQLVTLVCEVSAPEPDCNWPGSLDRRELFIDGAPVSLREHSQIADRVLQSTT
jgi:hypothetical protein